MTCGRRSVTCRWEIEPTLNDLQLLRAYEPVVQYTYGELFFPCAVEQYVAKCSLWLRRPDGKAEQLVARGELTIECLAEHPPAAPDEKLFLRFVEEPLEGRAFSRWLLRPERPRFRTQGRLARVGIGMRALDSLFGLGLLLRGRVPGGTVAAADEQYRQIWANAPYHPYYGKVTRQGSYIALNYLFFYAMNDWRTTFYGANDHEADWEQIFVYLEDRGPDPPEPVWVAFAAHDLHGDDLRRRWDDPELSWEDDHIVVFAGAGSHAGYFKPGEYLTRYQVRYLEPLARIMRRARHVWNETLRQGVATGEDSELSILSFPFIDYARGDGLTIGPGQSRPWRPVLLTEDSDWAQNYRGLWGLDTRDPFEGESAPAGPKFNRAGTVRTSWHNPVGWAGLLKVAPPRAAAVLLRERIDELTVELDEVEQRIVILGRDLPQLGLEVGATRQAAHLDGLNQVLTARMSTAEGELNALYLQRAGLVELLDAAHTYLADVEEEARDHPHAHLSHRNEPQSSSEIRESRLAEGWAAFSVGLLLIGFVAVVAIHPSSWSWFLAGMVGAFLVIDAALRRHMTNLIVLATVMLATASLLILIYEYYLLIILVGVVLLSALIIFDNFRELRQR